MYPWSPVLDRLFAARAHPLYMPCALLAAVSIADEAPAFSGTILFLELEARFQQLIAPICPKGMTKAWEPFFHLSKTAAVWTLWRGPTPASFADLSAGRPKDRGSLTRRADRAVFTPGLLPALLHPGQRRLLASDILSRLSCDTEPLRQALASLKALPVGVEYRFGRLPQFVAESSVQVYDPRALQAATTRHHELQEALARLLQQEGHAPLRPRALDPQFDLAWRDEAALNLVEVKSLSEGGEDHQLRLGLGQVLDYRHQLSEREPTRAILAVEREPRRAHWRAVCSSVGVLLLTGPRWQGLTG